MKDNKIDNLFRAGLSQNKLTPPPPAWDRIEKELPSKSKKGAWYFISIAASLALILSLGWIFLGESTIETTNKLQEAKIQPTVSDKETSSVDPKKEDLVPEIIEPIEKIETISLAKTAKQLRQKSFDHNIQFSDTETNSRVDKKPVAIELVRLKSLKQISFVSLNDFKFQTTTLNVKESLQAYLSKQPNIDTSVPKKKKFSVLGSIVSVAKGVNQGKIGLSEFRKSKNEFIMNELKYGDKSESDDDDEDAPLNK